MDKHRMVEAINHFTRDLQGEEAVAVTKMLGNLHFRDLENARKNMKDYVKSERKQEREPKSLGTVDVWGF